LHQDKEQCWLQQQQQNDREEQHKDDVSQHQGCAMMPFGHCHCLNPIQHNDLGYDHEQQQGLILSLQWEQYDPKLISPTIQRQ
jgi:hypothetical protein